MKKENKSKKIMKGIIISFYAIFAIFFINTMSVSAKAVEEKEITPKAYTLILQERGGAIEQINGTDIELKYISEAPKVITYNENLLKDKISKLSCLDNTKIIKSQSANFVYQNGGYVIAREMYGNEINYDILYDNVVKAIKNGDVKLNLEATKCYKDPKFTEKSSEVIKARDILNKYVSSKITYKVAGLTQVADNHTISNCLEVDQNMQVIVNESRVREYVDTIAKNYTSQLGISIKVSGGYNGNNHSWIIDTPAETKALIQNIKNGQTITKYPAYAQTSAAWCFSNVGDTFVEVDMAKQHLWYYRNGYLVVDGDIVTGNVSNGCTTPEGVFNLYSKQKDTVLRGDGYASPVSFWMPFNKNIGLHDASWRSEFGGEIYKTDGSHGCVNAPYYLAKTVYDNIKLGNTIICHN